jgi:signal transduction histidine kinase
MKFLPRSLFSRLMIVFLIGLIIAQGVGLTIMLQDRGESLSQASGVQSVRRIADTVLLFDAVNETERERLVKLLSSPSMRILITPQLPASFVGLIDQRSIESPQSQMFTSVLQRILGRDREIRLVVLERDRATQLAVNEPRRAMTYPRSEVAGAVGYGHSAQSLNRAHMRASVVAQIRLQDGNWVVFDSQLQAESASWPYRVMISLLVLLIAVVVMAFVGVRWVTRPLKQFALAATELGKNIDRPPLPEMGPAEVIQAARALNGMQARLSRYLQDRTRILAAMSHDLKTPITRMRLRAELLDDGHVREKFTRDLAELESMVSGTLDFMRGLEGTEALQPVDLNALLESLQADARELGHRVEISGVAEEPFECRPSALKRCLSNLIENAIKYGDAAHVRLMTSPDALHIVIKDEGPGVPATELERLFEPFYRLESSRNRDHGGTGLGLTIARSIAEQHGGTLILKNGVDQGLESHLILPINRSKLSRPSC